MHFTSAIALYTNLVYTFNLALSTMNTVDTCLWCSIICNLLKASTIIINANVCIRVFVLFYVHYVAFVLWGSKKYLYSTVIMSKCQFCQVKHFTEISLWGSKWRHTWSLKASECNCKCCRIFFSLLTSFCVIISLLINCFGDYLMNAWSSHRWSSRGTTCVENHHSSNYKHAFSCLFYYI